MLTLVVNCGIPCPTLQSQLILFQPLKNGCNILTVMFCYLIDSIVPVWLFIDNDIPFRFLHHTRLSWKPNLCIDGIPSINSFSLTHVIALSWQLYFLPNYVWLFMQNTVVLWWLLSYEDSLREFFECLTFCSLVAIWNQKEKDVRQL